MDKQFWYSELRRKSFGNVNSITFDRNHFNECMKEILKSDVSSTKSVPNSETVQFLEMAQETLKSDWAKIRMGELIDYFKDSKSAPKGCGKHLKLLGCECGTPYKGHYLLCVECDKDAVSEPEDQQ